MTARVRPYGLRRLYANRFSPAEGTAREAVWRVLCTEFFQRWIDPGSTVLEIGSGYCEFINNILAARKIAVDLNPEIKRRAARDVQTIVTSATDLAEVPSGSVDVVFAANFFEHITKEEIAGAGRGAPGALAPGQAPDLSRTYGCAARTTGCSSITSRRWTSGR